MVKFEAFDKHNFMHQAVSLSHAHSDGNIGLHAHLILSEIRNCNSVGYSLGTVKIKTNIIILCTSISHEEAFT